MYALYRGENVELRLIYPCAILYQWWDIWAYGVMEGNLLVRVLILVVGS